ncbi:twin-arginine translocation signal domain-containing protein [Enterobacter kobei]|uniref:twin-arginine translocation signal domain-containing protein n=1 Tax=Enterobacter kobei TaxID=208224 RepID=UPI00388DCC54
MLLKTSRRTFLKGLTLSGVAGSLGVWSFNARSSLSLPVAASLQGTQFDLTIGETPSISRAVSVRPKQSMEACRGPFFAGKKVTPLP